MDTQKGSPKISVLLPSFNSGEFLRDALDSVIAQSFADWEIVVMDGGSTDGSLGILKEYARKYPNIRVFSERDESHYHAIHKALERAGGEFIYILSASDGYLDKDWFGKCIDVMQSDREISLVWGIPMDASENGTILGPAYTYSHFFKKCGEVKYKDKGKVSIGVRMLGKLKTGNLAALVRKINRWNLYTLAKMFRGPMNIPKKQDWFFYWLRAGQIFPDGNMCVAGGPLKECLSLYTPGVDEPGSWMSFFFDFNSRGYLSYGIPTAASFGRFHKMQNTEAVRAYDDADRVKYFKKLKDFKREYKKHPEKFRFLDREGNSIV